jgi:hypothetical protein
LIGDREIENAVSIEVRGDDSLRHRSRSQRNG